MLPCAAQNAGNTVKCRAPLGLGLLVLGCLGQVPPPVVPDRVVPDQAVQAQDPGSVVRSISVVADKTSLSAEKITRLESHGTLQRLDNALMAQLAAVGRFGTSGQLELQVRQTRFRLRTAAGALWDGLAGPDLLDAESIRITSRSSGKRLTISR